MFRFNNKLQQQRELRNRINQSKQINRVLESNLVAKRQMINDLYKKNQEIFAPKEPIESHEEPIESHEEPIESHEEPIESHEEPIELQKEELIKETNFLNGVRGLANIKKNKKSIIA